MLASTAMAEKQPITIAEYNALSISNALNFGYYYVQGAIDITQVLANGQATDRYVNALRQWDLPIGSRFGSPRPRSLGFQEIDSLQSNVVWYEAERVVCLYHHASLGANFMDAYMGATAFRQVRQDRLRQQTGFPIAGLASLVVTDANRKSLASALEAPGSDAALAQEGPALPPQCVLAPDEITQLIEAGHLPPQAAGGGDYGAGTASPATPPAQVEPTRTVTPLSGADLLERRVAAPTPPAPSVSVPAVVPGSSVLAAASSTQRPDPFLPVPSPSVSGTQHGVDAMTASLTLCTDAYVPTAVALTSLQDALQRDVSVLWRGLGQMMTFFTMWTRYCPPRSLRGLR